MGIFGAIGKEVNEAAGAIRAAVDVVQGNAKGAEATLIEAGDVAKPLATPAAHEAAGEKLVR